jgi:hypothetical protein
MAKIKVFQYFKEGGERKDYELMIIKDMDSALEGISLHDMSKEDRTKVLDIQKKYEEALEPYMKSYRKFLKSKITKTYN